MHTEITEVKGKGSIFYDADCPVCLRGMKVFGAVFAGRGFAWQPLQTPGAAHCLRVSEAALLEEMKLQLPDGRVLGGIDSWIHLFRSVWCLWPVGTLLAVPGLHRVGQVCYRWITRNRYCFGGKCSVRTKQRHRRTIPFMDLP